MKKVIMAATLLIVLALNFLVAEQSFSIKGEPENIRFLERAYASGGANCWSQTKAEDGSSVLRCVVCTYKENSIGVGHHDGTCPEPPQ